MKTLSFLVSIVLTLVATLSFADDSSLRSFTCRVQSDGLLHREVKYYLFQIDIDDSSFFLKTVKARIRSFSETIASSTLIYDGQLLFTEKCDAPRSTNYMYCKLEAEDSGLFGGKVQISAFGYNWYTDKASFSEFWVMPKAKGIEYARGTCESGVVK